MNKQRKVLITITYNELGIIVDTKTEELGSSAQPEQRWIPVSEKPPKEDTEVLTYDSSFGITFDSLHRGKWRKHPVAWMPLPEPPKDGGDE